MIQGFQGFPVIEIDRIVRRTLWSAVGVAILAVGVSYSMGQPLIAAGAIVGLALGVVNGRVYRASAARLITPEGKVLRKPFGASVAGRLALITLIAFGLLYLLRPMGWGVIAGLAAFQVLMMVNALKVLIHYQRSALAGDAGE